MHDAPQGDDSIAECEPVPATGPCYCTRPRIRFTTQAGRGLEPSSKGMGNSEVLVIAGAPCRSIVSWLRSYPGPGIM